VLTSPVKAIKYFFIAIDALTQCAKAFDIALPFCLSLKFSGKAGVQTQNVHLTASPANIRLG